MKKSLTMKFEVVENGLLVQVREGNRWSEKRWVMDFRDRSALPFEAYGEPTIVGEFVRKALVREGLLSADKVPLVKSA